LRLACGLPGSQGGIAFLHISFNLKSSLSPRLPPLAWAWLMFSRRRFAYKAPRFRAALVQLDRRGCAERPFPLCCNAGFSLAHVTPQEAEKMTIIEFAFVLNAIARLVTAVATLIPLIRRRGR
jgi:hypothetical protein